MGENMQNKFRVWDKTKHQWIHHKCGLLKDGSLIILLPGDIVIDIDLKHVVIQFYTGRKDINNEKEIYEGDIIEGEYRLRDYFHKPIGIVRNDEVNLGLSVLSNSVSYEFDRITNIKILGNICDNRDQSLEEII
jgi:hypothetical protein